VIQVISPHLQHISNCKVTPSQISVNTTAIWHLSHDVTVTFISQHVTMKIFTRKWHTKNNTQHTTGTSKHIQQLILQKKKALEYLYVCSQFCTTYCSGIKSRYDSNLSATAAYENMVKYCPTTGKAINLEVHETTWGISNIHSCSYIYKKTHSKDEKK
jgi:hypothetical protein